MQNYYLLRAIGYNLALMNALPFGEVTRIDKNFDKSYLLLILICQVMFACNHWLLVLLWYLPIDTLAHYFCDVNTHKLLASNGIASAEPDFQSTFGRQASTMCVMAVGFYLQ